LQSAAVKLGFDRSYLSRLETGKAQNPSTDFIRRVCAVFGVDEQWLELGTGTPDRAAESAPWGRELEESTQFTAAFALFAEELTYQQLLRCIQKVIRHSGLSEKSKVFWTKMLGEWAVVKMGLAERATTGVGTTATRKGQRKKN